MKASETAIELIKELESYRKHAYLCAGGRWTVGYGHTEGVKLGDKMEKDEAERKLKDRIEKDAAWLSGMVLKLNQNQFDALLSFIYNVGRRAFEESTLLRLILRNPNDLQIKVQFLRWNKAKGQIVSGLTKRRIRETELYFKEI